VTPGTLLAALLAASPPAPAVGTPAGAVSIERGRVNEVMVLEEVGKPLERAVTGRAYERAAAADAEQRWSEAESLYREAVVEWAAAGRKEPTRTLELAIAKAERERQRSQRLAIYARSAAQRALQRGSARPDAALDEARLLRGKLMAVRAVSSRVSPAVYGHTRARLEDALHGRGTPSDPEDREAAPAVTAENRGSEIDRRPPHAAEIELLLCAVRAIGGEPEAARLARAHVTEAERGDPANTLALAVCAAALDERDAALRTLELYVLHPGPGHPDRVTLHDLYLWNDWDRLRGDPRFESLFPR
jgi:hypothetical protein